ncbi:MAG: hypothetical protein FJY44_05755 [Betaproteobacteria bacterium]|nr:hypothetical protein [Betaproteobacteria bacterium]
MARKTEEDNNPILSICAHIANGSKHFVLGDKHTAVKDISVTGHFFGGKFFDGNFFGDLYIELSGVTAQQFGEKIDALSLAKEVLAFWKKDSRLKIALPAKDNA